MYDFAVLGPQPPDVDAVFVYHDLEIVIISDNSVFVGSDILGNNDQRCGDPLKITFGVDGYITRVFILIQQGNAGVAVAVIGAFWGLDAIVSLHKGQGWVESVGVRRNQLT